jgi:hypothetical protein
VLVLLPIVAEAAEYATFESFYRQGWTLSWKIALAFAILAGAAVWFFAPPAGAAVTAIGSWIGSAFGYSGIAASNFGLALLGGGAVAAGGLGMAGGTAVLAAAFSFGTDIVIDFTSSSVIEKYQYERFAEASREMTTLPLPRNGEGPDSYESAIKVLKGIDERESLSSAGNRAVVLKAIDAMKAIREEALSEREAARKYSMLSLLHFVTNDYRAARHYAYFAFREAQDAEIPWTMPAFLFAASLLYDEKMDFRQAIAPLRYSIHAEPDNPLTPLLLSVFLDRMMFRLNDGALTPRQFHEVASVADFKELGAQWVPAQIVVLSRHVLLLKKEQQRISSLVLLGSSNAAIRDSELTLSRVKRSFVEYEEYLQQAQYLVGALSSPQSSDGKSAAAQVRELRRLVTSYSGDRSRLEGLVAALEARQAEHRQMLAQMKELSDYMKRLEAEAKSIDALAGSVSSAIWDSKVTLTNASGSLREYEQLLDGAQDVARVLSSPKTLPDEQSDASVIEARSELTSYVNDLPRLRSLVESLEARQSEVQARVNRKRVIAVLMCILLLGLGIGLVRRRWIVRKPG